MDLTEFGVSLEALEAAAKGIDDAVAALADIGVKQTADAGRGVELLAVSRVDMGHDGLASALGEFCDRWEWGVRSLVREGMAIRQSLLDTRDAYQRVEDTVGGIFKRLVQDVCGNPMADSNAAAGKSWRQLNEELKPDYSAESARRSLEAQRRAMEQAGEDLKTIGRHVADPTSPIIDALSGQESSR
ncbi:hypothetical protein [Carbonactinospora thermoautotrophica]|uniref:hypothetical protein n=1 Tax=Carbonactinospora thermoautotrophica TaxID=1469144 RepID=UPI000836FC31|nr:hypothetical protein [Carbonactinospora thermoautotrophica]